MFKIFNLIVLYVKYGLQIERFQSSGVKARGDQDASAPQPHPSQWVGKERMLRCSWGTSVCVWGYTVRCCGHLVLWRPQAPYSSLTELSDAFCICLIFDTPTHHRFLGFFLPTEPDFCGWGRKLEKETCIEHVACDWSLCFGNLQFCRSWWVLPAVFSVPFCYTCAFFFFNKNSSPLKILWIHCPHFPSPSICLHYLFSFSFIYYLALQIVSYFAFPVELFIL